MVVWELKAPILLSIENNHILKYMWQLNLAANISLEGWREHTYKVMFLKETPKYTFAQYDKGLRQGLHNFANFYAQVFIWMGSIFAYRIRRHDKSPCVNTMGDSRIDLNTNGVICLMWSSTNVSLLWRRRANSSEEAILTHATNAHVDHI